MSYKDLRTARGSLKEWSTTVERLRENRCARLITTASFASGIIWNTDCLPFVISICGNAISKDILLITAASIWGNARSLIYNEKSSRWVYSQAGKVLLNMPLCIANAELLGTDCVAEIERLYSSGKLLSLIITSGELKTEMPRYVVDCKDDIIKQSSLTAQTLLENYGTAGDVFIETDFKYGTPLRDTNFEDILNIEEMPKNPHDLLLYADKFACRTFGWTTTLSEDDFSSLIKLQ